MTINSCRRKRAAGVAMGCVFAAAAVGLGAAPAARADDIYVRSGQAAEMAFENITVRSLKDGELYFTTANSGRESHRPVGEINRLELTGETQFNNAERAYSEARATKDEAAAKRKYADAVTGYAATLASTGKPWLKDFVAARMQVAGPGSGRFDAALVGWKAMVEKDPAAALKVKPSPRGLDPTSQYLVGAAKDLRTSADAAVAKPEARRAYLDLLLDVQTAMNDHEGAMRTAEAKVQLGGSPAAIAELALKQAQHDAAGGRFDAAAARLSRADLSALPEAERADAGYLLAECRAANLQPTSPADQWKDAAIEYMKIVAAYPGGPSTAAALLKVAQIHETLQEPDTALKVYQQVAREHADTPAAQAAREAIERLGKTARG